MSHVAPSYVIRRALTGELSMKDSPVRQFFDVRFLTGLRDVQARFRAGAGPLLVAGAPQRKRTQARLARRPTGCCDSWFTQPRPCTWPLSEHGCARGCRPLTRSRPRSAIQTPALSCSAARDRGAGPIRTT